MGINVESQEVIDEAIDRAKAAGKELLAQASMELEQAVVLAGMNLIDHLGGLLATVVGDFERIIHAEIADLKTWVETLGVDVSADVVRRPK